MTVATPAPGIIDYQQYADLVEQFNALQSSLSALPQSDEEPAQYTITTTTYTTGSIVSGTGNVCGVAFVGPTSGRVCIHWAGQQANSGASFTVLSIHVRTGSIINAGTDVFAASNDAILQVIGTNSLRMGVFHNLSGLTPGADYNVVLEHRVGANTGTILRRQVLVQPLL